MIGDRLPNLLKWTDEGHPWLNCTAGDLQKMFCGNSTCDPYFTAHRRNGIRYERAIVGIASGMITSKCSRARVMHACDAQKRHGQSTRRMIWSSRTTSTPLNRYTCTIQIHRMSPPILSRRL
jgi:hypothetical protein